MPRRHRPKRRPMPSRTPSQIGRRGQTKLRRAHHLLENGNHAQAGQIFERLAGRAGDLGRLKNATHLYLQAGRAYILSGNLDRGKECFLSGLRIIANVQRWEALAQIGGRVTEELHSLGYSETSAEISRWLETTLPEPIPNYQPIENSIQSLTRLPLKCPHCGGALRPGEVEMLDALTGECPYCGSAVRES